jgi:hypothetical protein
MYLIIIQSGKYRGVANWWNRTFSDYYYRVRYWSIGIGAVNLHP